MIVNTSTAQSSSSTRTGTGSRMTFHDHPRSIADFTPWEWLKVWSGAKGKQKTMLKGVTMVRNSTHWLSGAHQQPWLLSKCRHGRSGVFQSSSSSSGSPAFWPGIQRYVLKMSRLTQNTVTNLQPCFETIYIFRKSPIWFALCLGSHFGDIGRLTERTTSQPAWAAFIPYFFGSSCG